MATLDVGVVDPRDEEDEVDDDDDEEEEGEDAAYDPESEDGSDDDDDDSSDDADSSDEDAVAAAAARSRKAVAKPAVKPPAKRPRKADTRVVPRESVPEGKCLPGRDRKRGTAHVAVTSRFFNSTSKFFDPHAPTKGSLSAIIGVEPHTLILGTQASDNAIDMAQAFATNENAFWHVIGDALGFRRGFHIRRADAVDSIRRHLLHPPETACAYEQAVERLTAAGFAIWDIVAQSERGGSLDQDIRKPRFHDVRQLLADYPSIRRICFATGVRAPPPRASSSAPRPACAMRSLDSRASLTRVLSRAPARPSVARRLEAPRSSAARGSHGLRPPARSARRATEPRRPSLRGTLPPRPAGTA